MLNEEKLAEIRAVAPPTLRSLFMLRIALCVLAAGFAMIKIGLSSSVADFFLDILTDSPAGRVVLGNWMHTLHLLVCGLLACALSLVVATFFIQARLLARIEREPAEPSPGAWRGLSFILDTLKVEGSVAVVTGLLTCAISKLLAPDVMTMGGAASFGLAGGVAAGALDTLYFHLFLVLREAPAQAAEKRYRRGIEQARQRLSDGSMRLQEALIGRFEADYRRTVAMNRIGQRSRRQVREARRLLRARLWVVKWIIPGEQLAASIAEAKTDPNLLERWTDQVDALVDARTDVQRGRSFASNLIGALWPAGMIQKTLNKWDSFGRNNPERAGG